MKHPTSAVFFYPCAFLVFGQLTVTHVGKPKELTPYGAKLSILVLSHGQYPFSYKNGLKAGVDFRSVTFRNKKDVKAFVTEKDPAVATIFATKSEGFGDGVVYMTTTEKLSSAGVSKNVLAAQEKEVVVDGSPAEFPKYATFGISAKEVRGILKEMALNIPSKIKNADMDRVLNETRRLSPDEYRSIY